MFQFYPNHTIRSNATTAANINRFSVKTKTKQTPTNGNKVEKMKQFLVIQNFAVSKHGVFETNETKGMPAFHPMEFRSRYSTLYCCG